ncbi:MAG: signal peptide peptidase SppA [Methylocystis sp.]|nr:signal peptide peptidase SppA [Methylocystis sp.]
MSPSSDYLIDRRRLRRKLSFWRLAAIAAIAAAALFAILRYGGPDPTTKLVPHIARLSIQGLITGDSDTIDLIKSIGDSRASAVLLDIDSPGGTTTGAEKIYDEVRRLAAKKPVVAVVGTLAASGGYIAAIGADAIVARGNSLVGSIGVLFQYPNFHKAMETVGVKVEEVKSSPLKAAPNPFEPASEAARAAIADLVGDSFTWFKELVKERRNLDDAELAKVVDGRVFTGRQGVPLKLVDMIGGEREAIEWLETTKGVAKKLPVRDWKKPRSFERLGLLDSAASVARTLGFASLAGLLEQGARTAATGMLDGMVAIWQAPSSN